MERFYGWTDAICLLSICTEASTAFAPLVKAQFLIPTFPLKSHSGDLIDMDEAKYFHGATRHGVSLGIFHYSRELLSLLSYVTSYVIYPCQKGNEGFQLKTHMERMHLSYIKMTAKDYSKKGTNLQR